MNRPTEPTDGVESMNFRLDTGIDVLETWTAGADDADRSLVYQALFAMTDQSLFRTHRIVDDWQRLSEFFVLLREDLVLKLRVHCFDSFGVVYVGPADQAPGLVIPKRTRRQRRVMP